MNSSLISYIARLLKSQRIRSLLADSWKMGWPLIIVMFLEFLVSITDVYVAGKIGRETQAAVGFTAQLYFVFIVLANALTMGTVAVMSKLHGGGKRSEFSQTLYTVLTASCAAGILLGIFAFLISPLVISISSIPSSIKEIALPFVRIYLIALPFHYLLITTNGVLRATRRALRSLITMTIVGAINIGLNLLFLYHTTLSYRGIAISTAAAIIIGSALNAITVRKMICAKCRFSMDVLRRIAKIGFPSLIMQVSWQLGSLTMFFILGMLGDKSVDVMAAFTTGLRIESAIFLPAYALNMSAAALSGNLLGAKKEKDAFASGIITAALGMGVIILLSVAVILNARNIASHLSGSPLVINECVRYLIIQMLAEPFMAVLVTLTGSLNGAGDTFGVMRIVVGGMWIIRVPLSWLLAIHFGLGPAAVWCVMDFDIIVRMTLILRRYIKKDWIIHA
ncbi:MAG TPA: MATE family efflux transporter [Spirochaetota bacterium]